jgi:hypothetical protein
VRLPQNGIFYFWGKNTPHKLNEKSMNSRNRNGKCNTEEKQSSISQEKKNKDLVFLWPIENATEDEGGEYQKNKVLLSYLFYKISSSKQNDRILDAVISRNNSKYLQRIDTPENGAYMHPGKHILYM